VRQQVRARRRAERGLPAKQVQNPGGARTARADGIPLKAYRRDTLSRSYQRTRADHASNALARSQAKHARASHAAARIVAVHGNAITVEDCAISTWAKLWGKRIQLFSPGMLIAALAAECHATDGRLQRASIKSTALSQHCLYGLWVPKTLAQRTHHCPGCGLRADRDIAAAMLAACVELTNPADPATARVDYELAHAVGVGLASQQEARAQSTGTSHQHDQCAGLARVGSHHSVASAERATTTRPTPEQTSAAGRRGSSRKSSRTSGFGGSMPHYGLTLR
jgi:hypothetical protein